jgi:hypothetical protein
MISAVADTWSVLLIRNPNVAFFFTDTLFLEFFVILLEISD